MLDLQLFIINVNTASVILFIQMSKFKKQN